MVGRGLVADKLLIEGRRGVHHIWARNHYKTTLNATNHGRPPGRLFTTFRRRSPGRHRAVGHARSNQAVRQSGYSNGAAAVATSKAPKPANAVRAVSMNMTAAMQRRASAGSPPLMTRIATAPPPITRPKWRESDAQPPLSRLCHRIVTRLLLQSYLNY